MFAGDRRHARQRAPSRPESEPVLPAMGLPKTRDPLIISDQWTIKLNRRRDQKPVCGIPVLEMMQLIAAAGGAIAERRGLDAGMPKESLYPSFDGKIKIDPSGVD